MPVVRSASLHGFAEVPGAQRLVDFAVEKSVRIDNASSLRWNVPELSRFNPPTLDHPGPARR